MATIVTRAVKGAALTHTEMDANFNNLNTDKADVIGTPATGDFAQFDANDDIESNYSLTTLAAAINSILLPVGSIYTNANVSTNPATLLGFGTWVAFGAGRVPVGIDSGDVDFDTGEETGGAKTHTLSLAELPAHDHGSAGSHSHSLPTTVLGSGGTRAISQNAQSTGTMSTGSAGTHTHTSVGSGTAHTIVQPYIVVYMWKRTA